MSEWVPEGDLAHFVSDLVETGALDLAGIYSSYEDERGFPPYDPRLMLKLLLYGYANGVMSSRKLEAATYRDVAVRMLCAGQHPDFCSIARFRKRHLAALSVKIRGQVFTSAQNTCCNSETGNGGCRRRAESQNVQAASPRSARPSPCDSSGGSSA